MPLNITTTRERLQNFDFKRLFIEELGWSNPPSTKPVTSQLSAKNAPPLAYTRTPIAQLAGAVVLEITTGHGFPDARARTAIQKHVSEQHLENLLIFLDAARTQSLWYWVKREAGKEHARDHLYVKGQRRNYELQAVVEARLTERWQFLNLVPQHMMPPVPRKTTRGKVRLAEDGRNIAEYLEEIRHLSQPAFDGIIEAMGTFRPKDQFLVSPMVDKGKLLAGAPGETKRLFDGGCAKVFVLWDWHPLEARWSDQVKQRWKPDVCRMEAHDLRGKFNAADLQSGRIVLICVAQELEAWALADRLAIAKIIAKRRRPPLEPVRKTRKPEQCPNPEQTLENIFREFDVELAKYTDVPAIIEQAQTTRFKHLKTCPSFVRLVEKLTGQPFDQAVETTGS